MKGMKLIFILVLLINANFLLAARSYKIHFISFDSDFYTPTEAHLVEGRAEAILNLSSKNLDLIFDEIHKKCNLKHQSLRREYRIQIKDTKGAIIFIDDEKFFLTFKGVCKFNPEIESEIIQNILRVVGEKSKAKKK